PPLPRRDPPSRSWTNGATSTTRSSRHRDRSGQGAVARRTARAGGGRFVIPLEDDLPAPRRAAMTARRAAGWLALAGIVALSFNLRPAAVSVGPLLAEVRDAVGLSTEGAGLDRKSTRLNSSHVKISYAVFCLKQKKVE